VQDPDISGAPDSAGANAGRAERQKIGCFREMFARPDVPPVCGAFRRMTQAVDGKLQGIEIATNSNRQGFIARKETGLELLANTLLKVR
jgi:hypothetical protein